MLTNSSVFSVIDDTTKEIVYRDYVDISVAVATPKVRQVPFTVMLSVSASLDSNVKSRKLSRITSLSGSRGSCNPKRGGNEFY